MDDKFEKKLKEFLPYIIIIGVVYLFAPAILVFTKSTGLLNQLIYIGLLPLTALLCNLYYSFKKTSDFFLSLVAPIIYIPSMLLYGNIRDSVLNSLIYLVSYFICGYIGLTLGEMLRGSANKDNKGDVRRKRVPSVVDTATAKETFEEEAEKIELPQSFEQVEEIEASESETQEPLFEVADTYSEDDVDAILAELHNRNN